MTQAVLVEEVLPKHMAVRDQVVAQRVGAEGKPDTCTGVVVVNVSPQVVVSGSQR
jgi:hypothetical protein